MAKFKPTVVINWGPDDTSTWQAKSEDEALFVATVLTGHMGATTAGEFF